MKSWLISFLKKLCSKQSQPATLKIAICNCIWVPTGFSKCFTNIRPCHAHILLVWEKGTCSRSSQIFSVSPYTTSFKGFQPKDKHTFVWKWLQDFKASLPCLFYLHASYRLACPSLMHSKIYCHCLILSSPWLLRPECSKARSDDTPVAQV